MSQRSNGDIILVAGIPGMGVLKDLLKFQKEYAGKIKIACIYSVKIEKLTKTKREILGECDIVVPLKSLDEHTITESILPIKDDLLAITSRSESQIPLLAKIVPHVAYLRTPTVKSLLWSINKVEMRKRFRTYDKKITPNFMIVHDSGIKTTKDIEAKIGFPLVVKPTGLAQSLLVSVVYHHEELEKELRKIFRKIKSLYKETGRTDEPNVLVEEYMDGDMYSIDAFVTSRGKVTCCPAVRIKTGKDIGFDDFFGYQQMTPTLLNKESIEKAEEVVKKAIHAVGLRSSSAHVELMKTEQGWKVIELGPRIGGFRSILYRLTHNIDMTACDLYTRIPQKINIPKKAIGYAATLKFFARHEGYIKTLTGTKKAKELKSFYTIVINNKIGDRAVFAKNGGKSVFNITLFNKDRSKLLADIRRLEQFVNIETSKKPLK
jgi:biotin carboxylase